MKGIAVETLFKVFLLFLIAIIIVLFLNIASAGAVGVEVGACQYQYYSALKDFIETTNKNLEKFEEDPTRDYFTTFDIEMPYCTWGSAMFVKGDMLMIVVRSRVAHTIAKIKNTITGGIIGSVVATVVCIVAVIAGGPAGLLAITSLAAVGGGALGAYIGFHADTDCCIDIPLMPAPGEWVNFSYSYIGSKCDSSKIDGFEIYGKNTYRIKAGISSEKGILEVINLGCSKPPCYNCLDPEVNRCTP